MDIKKVGIVGCGLMGAGIAQVAAQAGYDTIVRELNEELLEKGLGRISAFLDKGVAKKKLTQARRDATWARISGTTDLAGARAAFERALQIRQEFLGKDHPRTVATRSNLDSLQSKS